MSSMREVFSIFTSTPSVHRRSGDFNMEVRLLRITGMACVIGGLSTLAAFALLAMIRFFTNLFFFQSWSFAERSPANNGLGAYVIVLPVIGGLLIGVMARWGSEKIRGHGIPEAIEAILFGKSQMSPKVAILKPLSSGIVIGSGGPFGAEGPIIMTGGAIGSLLAQHFHLSAAERKALLVAGAVAGMTAVFGTPVAAVLLAVELLLFELRPRSLLPVVMACAVAGFLRPLLMEPGPIFALHTAVPGPLTLLSSAVAGLACGCLAAALSTSLYKMEDLFGKLPVHWMWWPAIGGFVVGVGGWLQPRALGVGYDVIGDLLNNRLALGVVCAVLTVKAIIWVVALGSGTSGGVLAPLLMMGAGMGVMLGHVLPGPEAALWPLVCMAATLSGTLRAPLTAAVFSLELSGNMNALLPLLTASAMGYGFTVLTMHRSILTEKIARRGRHIYQEHGIDPLEREFIAKVMTHTVQKIDAAMPMDQVMVRYFGAGQIHRAYPVVQDGVLLGMADRALLQTAIQSLDEMSIGEVFKDQPPPHFAMASETCRKVATRMARHGLERLPVVSDPSARQVVGIVSRSDLIKPTLAHFYEEEHREQIREMGWKTKQM